MEGTGEGWRGLEGGMDSWTRLEISTLSTMKGAQQVDHLTCLLQISHRSRLHKLVCLTGRSSVRQSEYDMLIQDGHYFIYEQAPA
jgi:hypothetical protein